MGGAPHGGRTALPQGAMLLASMTTDEVRAFCTKPPTAVLVPVGSVEPHGPHLPLGTDTIISDEAAKRAAKALAARGVPTVIAPALPYGVTDYASGFAGAIGVPADVLRAMLHAIASRLHADGFTHVCFVNNHLEPAHDRAVRGAALALPKGAVSVACPLTKRWARTLSEEFKRGDCHAGQYETSLVLAAGAAVRDDFSTLPTLDVSLAKEIRAGRTTFLDMGLTRAYTGAPSKATREEGAELYERLAEMIVTEVLEGLAALAG
jgi:creatinine amidohydrolase